MGRKRRTFDVGEVGQPAPRGAVLESMVVPSLAWSTHVNGLLEELTRDGLRIVLEVLLDIEADAYVESLAHCRDERGRAMVSRNGRARPRTVPMGRASITVRSPRVNDRRVIDGQRQRFASAILAPGKPPTLGGAYKLAGDLLHSWGDGDFSLVREHVALRGIAGGPKVEVVLLERWMQWKRRPIADLRFERVMAHVFDASPLAIVQTEVLLVLSGVLPSGRAELIDMRNGDPESEADWAALLSLARNRGLVGDATLVGVEASDSTAHAFAAAEAKTR